jgi:UDP-N-acetylglucosamine:LPS N-acetylglucosamine transferase
MSFPEFDRGKIKVLFFSRGRGRGHAMPDIRIAKELEQIRPDIQIRFVSYGTGACTIQEFGYPLIDLGLQDANGTAETTVLAGKLIGFLQPDLVVAHEEFAALPAAKIFSKPTVMITDFFTDPTLYSMQSLWFADHILFTDRRGVYPEPASAAGRTRYLGPVPPAFEFSRRQRRRARGELGLSDAATVVSVMPGSWTEAAAPIVDLVLPAFNALRTPDKHLIWLAGQDYQLISARVNGRQDVTVLETDWKIDRLMVASDIVITKANRRTVVELAILGIRTLSIGYGLKVIDEIRAAALGSNTTVAATNFRPDALALALAAPEPKPLRLRSRSCAAEIAKVACKSFRNTA